MRDDRATDAVCPGQALWDDWRRLHQRYATLDAEADALRRRVAQLDNKSDDASREMDDVAGRIRLSAQQTPDIALAAALLDMAFAAPQAEIDPVNPPWSDLIILRDVLRRLAGDLNINPF